MVATTPTYGLPYWQSTDPPCFGGDCQQDNPFCDFMTIVDEQLTTFDDYVARTATTVPFAQVSWLNPNEDLTWSGPVPFTNEDADTDNMVDLSAFAGIVPQRNGVYLVQMNVTIDGETADDINFVGISIGSLTDPFLGSANTQVASASFRSDGSLSRGYASVLWNFTSTSPNPRTIYASAEGPASTPLLFAELSATWVRDAF